MTKRKNGHKKSEKDKRKEEHERAKVCARLPDAHYDSLIDDDDEVPPGLFGHSSFSRFIGDSLERVVSDEYDPD